MYYGAVGVLGRGGGGGVGHTPPQGLSLTPPRRVFPLLTWGVGYGTIPCHSPPLTRLHIPRCAHHSAKHTDKLPPGFEVVFLGFRAQIFQISANIF